jgi:hypothetical protein
LQFPHRFSCFPWIGRQWVVEAHRAGPLTLAAFRLPGAEALSGECLVTRHDFSRADYEIKFLGL